jgi:hypothetical protein
VQLAAQPAAVVAAEVASDGGAAGLRRYRLQQTRIRGRGAGEGFRQQVLCCDSRRGGYGVRLGWAWSCMLLPQQQWEMSSAGRQHGIYSDICA